VSLPTATFALSGTVAKTSALFLRRRGRSQTARSGTMALARVDHVGYLRQGGRATPDPGGNQLPALPRLLAEGRASSVATVATVSRAPLVAVVAPDAVRHLDPARLDPAALEARQGATAAGGVELREYLRAITPSRPREVRAP